MWNTVESTTLDLAHSVRQIRVSNSISLGRLLTRKAHIKLVTFACKQSLNDDQNIGLIIFSTAWCEFFPVVCVCVSVFVLVHTAQNRHFLQFHLAHNNNLFYFVCVCLHIWLEVVACLMCDQENSQPFKEADGRGTKMEMKLLFCDNCMNNCACHFATTAVSIAAFFRLLLLLHLLSSASEDRHLRTVWIANYYTHVKIVSIFH